jgi:hypothetical protein
MRRLRTFGFVAAVAALAAVGVRPFADAAPRDICQTCNAIAWGSLDNAVQFVTDRSLRVVHGFQITVRIKQCAISLPGGHKNVLTDMPYPIVLNPDPLIHIGAGRFSFTRVSVLPAPMPGARWIVTGTITGTGVRGTRAAGTVSWSIRSSALAKCTPSTGSLRWTAYETGFANDDRLPPVSSTAAAAGGG